MARRKVLTPILAGGEGSRLDVLTRGRPKPALPIGGVYTLIDFPLSNCLHSDLADVWILEQYAPHALNEHLANGRPWDLDRTRGGLLVVPPHRGAGESGWYGGNADAIYRNRAAIRDFAPDHVLVLSADHVYLLDYGAVIDRHRESGADVTLVTTWVPLAEAGRYGVVRVAGDGRVTTFDYKPANPASDLVTTEVFVYDARALLETLDALVGGAEAAGDDDAGDERTTLRDFGHGLLPRLVRRGRAYAYRFDGYWRDVGTVESYWRAHMELLEPAPRLVLDDPRWPILTRGVQRRPARVEGSARIADGLISPGCTVRGRVERSVLAPGVVVEAGATVRDAVLLRDVTVGAGAVVERAILDRAVRVGAGAAVGGWVVTDDGDTDDPVLTAVGEGAAIPAAGSVAAGARFAPEARP